MDGVRWLAGSIAGRGDSACSAGARPPQEGGRGTRPRATGYGPPLCYLSRVTRPLARAAALAGPSALLAAYQLAPLPVALAAALGFLVCAWRWPAAALPAVVLALPFHQLLRPVIGAWSFSAAEVGIVLCAGGALLRLAGRGPNPPAPFPTREGGPGGVGLSSFDLAALAFVALGALSLTASIRPWESLRSLRTIVVEPVAFYFLVVWLGGGRPGARRLAGAVVASAVAVSLVGLYQYATNQNIITAEESLRRIRAFYGSPNNLGLYLGRAAPLALCLWAFGGGQWRYGLALVPIGAALVLTFSVGAWLGVVAALVFVAAVRGRRALIAVVAGLAALAALAAPLLLGLERFRSHLDFGEGTTFQRLQVWLSALSMVRDHPLLGIGLDNFLCYYRDLGYILPGGWREPNLSHPHNLVLDFWLSLGLAGLILSLALLARFFGVGLAVYRAEREPWARALALGIVASMVDFVAHGLIDNSYFLVDLAVLFWLSSAILRVLPAAAPRRARPEERPGNLEVAPP